MKNSILSIIVLLVLGIGKIIAQKFKVSPFTDSQTEIIANNRISHPIPNWQENWTKESVIAINKIIEEYGYPDESSPNRMYWIIPGKIQKTITYSENILFYLPFETNSCNQISEALFKNLKY